MSPRTHARFAAALAGSVFTTLSGAQVELHMTADDTVVGTARTVTWTLTVQGITDFAYFQVYDLNILASDDTVALADPFVDALTPLVNPSPGTAVNASIFGATGGQSTTLNPLGTILGSPIVIGTFTVTTTTEGQLTYTVEDGGMLTANTLRIRNNDFGPVYWDGPPAVFTADIVTIVPAPSSVLAFCGIALATMRRRRTE